MLTGYKGKENVLTNYILYEYEKRNMFEGYLIFWKDMVR